LPDSHGLDDDDVLVFGGNESAVGEICRLAGTMTEGFTAKKLSLAEKEK
jgi:hypothetical protein